MASTRPWRPSTVHSIRTFEPGANEADSLYGLVDAAYEKRSLPDLEPSPSKGRHDLPEGSGHRPQSIASSTTPMHRDRGPHISVDGGHRESRRGAAPGRQSLSTDGPRGPSATDWHSFRGRLT